MTTYWRGVGAIPTAAEVNDAGARVRAFWLAVAGNHLSPFQAQTIPAVDIIEETNGSLLTSGQITPTPAIVTGTGTGELYSPGNMALLQMETGVVQAGRRVRGRSNLGPLTEGAVASGQLGSPASALITGAAPALLAITPTTVKLVVWSRPQVGRLGAAFNVNSFSVPAKLAWLRSRRD